MKPVISQDPTASQVTYSHHVEEWGLTAFLLFLAMMAVWKGIPALWKRYLEIMKTSQELTERLINNQKESMDKMAEAMNSLNRLHESQTKILEDILRNSKH